jgi:hypothetical protein
MENMENLEHAPQSVPIALPDKVLWIELARGARPKRVPNGTLLNIGRVKRPIRVRHARRTPARTPPVF